MIFPAGTNEGEAAPPPALGVRHCQEQLILLLLLLHHPAVVKNPLTFDVIPALAVQLQSEIHVAEQLGHDQGHRHGLLVLYHSQAPLSYGTHLHPAVYSGTQANSLR
ncbi:hypothetical protein E2C01_035029 [Portunus trituberculatus]|uniref:Uncharacterized protein n=1 Tax=Portunus trituberculatus TaxID=210409 RepID=A0A5B7F8K9_PORTR|nr:hypothetical protein [Portunus trituberculatus]